MCSDGRFLQAWLSHIMTRPAIKYNHSSCTYYVLHCQYIMCMLNYKCLQFSYICNCMYVYCPLVICIQITLECRLVQFTFIENQFNAHSMWIWSIQNNVYLIHITFVMQASLKYYKERHCALLSDKALTQSRRAHVKIVTFEQN